MFLLLGNDIHKSALNNNDFSNLFTLKLIGNCFSCSCSELFLRSIGRDLNASADLTLKLNSNFNGIALCLLWVKLWPRLVIDRRVFTQSSWLSSSAQ